MATEKLTFEQACSSIGVTGTKKAAFAYFCMERMVLNKQRDLTSWRSDFRVFKDRDDHRNDEGCHRLTEKTNSSPDQDIPRKKDSMR